LNIVYSADHSFFSGNQFEKLKKLEDIEGINVFVHVGDGGPPLLPINTIDYLINIALFKVHDLDEFARLKQIQLFSAGMDMLDMERIRAKGITVKNASDVYSVPIAEFVLMRILEIQKSSRYFESIRSEKSTHKKRDLVELFGKTCAIYGYGSIGREISMRLKSFGVKTVGISRSGKKDEYLDEGYTVAESRKYIGEFDIVVSCLPQSEETEKFFNIEYFEAMKQNASFVNISRGGVVDETALIEAVKAGKFLGVALDVFEKEPLPQTSELWDLEGVYLSPHNSFASTIMYDRLFNRIYENLVAFIEENK
jgi:phosphoglycerate dehydrogenase-like enzyme